MRSTQKIEVLTILRRRNVNSWLECLPNMVRPLLAAFFLLVLSASVAWAQQPQPQQTPPDTKPARERHRIQEKEPPPPEGPWGSEEFGLTWRNPVWRGLVFDVGSYGGASLNVGAPRGVAAFSDGINPPVFERLAWNSERFDTTSITLAADLDMIRLSATYFTGTFHAQGEFSRDNGVSVSETDVDFHGPAYGFRVNAYWPALRYRDTLFDVSAGPTASVGWLHEQTRDIPGGVLLTSDAIDVLTGHFGPKASARAIFGRFELELNAEYSFMTGAMRGWTKEFSAGIGIHF